MDVDLVLDIVLVVDIVDGLDPVLVAPLLCPVDLPLSHQLHLDLLELLGVGQVEDQLATDHIPREEDPGGPVEPDEEILQSAHNADWVL